LIPVDGLHISGCLVQVNKSVRDSLAQAITPTARNVVEQRNCWLNLAHNRLDEAVLNGYAWPRDGSLEDSANLSAPDVIAAEIIEDLQAALEELQAISDELAETPGAKGGDTYAGENSFIQQNS